MEYRNAERPVLTISLLSSNRKDTIRKCLDSLNTLRERVDSELIIVDTGNNEEMRKIHEEYTDLIIPFTWCNDFSKARNVGLNAAKGEWFLYLDDDEWFIDTVDIEEFFLSGEYRDYGLAYYIQRNYGDYEGMHHSDARVSRLFPIRDKIQFVSTIHEYPVPLRGKTKLLHISHIILILPDQGRIHTAFHLRCEILIIVHSYNTVILCRNSIVLQNLPALVR